MLHFVLAINSTIIFDDIKRKDLIAYLLNSLKTLKTKEKIYFTTLIINFNFSF